MALISGLAGVVGRFAGRLVNSSLGWATILLFGKVSGRSQALLLGIALGSLVWVVLVIGVIVPDVGTTLLAFVPVPSFISEDLVRLAMLAAAVLLPLLVGVAAIFVTEKSKRPAGRGLIVALLRGYPFTLLLAVTIVFLAIVATVRKVQSLARRWEDAHVPMIVLPGRYDDLLAELEDVLNKGGVQVEQRPAPRVLSIPPKMLSAVAGSGIGSLVPDRLMLLKGPQFEALVYPSDLALGGKKENLAAGRALIAAELTDAPVYLTTTAETEAIEDELRAVTERKASAPPTELRDRLRNVDDKLMKLTVPFDEWETLYRERLQLERDVLASETDARAPSVATKGGPAVALAVAGEPVGRADVVEKALAVGAIGLIALDVVLLAADRLAPRRNRRRAS
jgi:hypothetical protein